MNNQKTDRSILELNKKNTVDFYHLALKEYKCREGMEKYAGEHYRQHNPDVPDDKEGFIEYFEDWGRQYPDSHSTVIRAFAEGNFVALQASHFITDEPGDTGLISMDLFELDEAGKLIEHWDGMQTPPLESRNGRSMIDGPTEVIDLDKTDANRDLIKKFNEEVLIAGDKSVIGTYFDGDKLIQHDPKMEDGVSGWLKALEEMEQKNEPMVYRKLHHIIAEGNFVMTMSEGDYGGITTAIWDLYRIEDGKIAEHWCAIWEKELLPDKFEHDNTLF